MWGFAAILINCSIPFAFIWILHFLSILDILLLYRYTASLNLSYAQPKIAQNTNFIA